MNILTYVLYGEVTVYDILIFAIVVGITYAIARILRSNIRHILQEKVAKDILNITEKIVYYGALLIGIVSVLPLIGVNLTGLLVAGGVVGLVVGFASQSVVSNLISGLFLVFERPVKIGEQIIVGQTSGVVWDIRILSTIVRTFEGEYVRIPNEKVFSSEITNLVANKARRIDYTVGISYSDDAQVAVDTIKRVIGEEPFVLQNPVPRIFVSDLAESSVTIGIKIWTPSAMWYDVKTEMLWKIKVELERAGITIPFPQRVLHIKKESAVPQDLPDAVPSEELFPSEKQLANDTDQ
ncbi:MAG: mechanosensitive ion channel family protein [Theionarchaea archaeon]|nr:mechanosensitive ion channel family protein [Theionarchaea archaeon]